jgi:hypothetical protein
MSEGFALASADGLALHVHRCSPPAGAGRF